MCIGALLKKWFNRTKRNKIYLNNIISCISYCPSSLPTIVKNELAQIIQILKNTEQALNEKELTVAVVGDFSVGKSSFISALIGKDVLPISAKPTTALITKIRYGKYEEAVVRYGDKEVKMSCQEYMKFSSYSIEDLKILDSEKTIQRYQGITEAVVYVNSPFLKEHKVCIIDTLGLNATEHDTQQTMSAVNGAIAVIYICKERGLSSNDLDFMSKNLNILADNLFICVNQSDMISKKEREEVVTTVFLKINHLLKQSNRSLPKMRIYSLSSRYERFTQNIVSDDEREYYNSSLNYKNRSGFLSLREELIAYLKRNSIKARIDYAQSQYGQIKRRLSLIAEQRAAQVEKSITQDEKTIKEANSTIDQNHQYIKIIHENCTGLREQINGVLISLSQQCIAQAVDAWTMERDALLKSFSFSNYDYTQWAEIEDKLFISRGNRVKSMRELFSPFVQIMISYFNRNISIVGNHIVTLVESSCRHFHQKYGHNALLANNLKIVDSLIIDSENHKELFAVSITDGLWSFLRENRRSFSVISARVRNIIGKNNQYKRVNEMLEVAKNVSLKSLSEHIDLCADTIRKQLDVEFSKFINSTTHNLRMEIEGKCSLIRTIEQHKKELIACKESEQAFFVMINQMLVDEKEKIEIKMRSV